MINLDKQSYHFDDNSSIWWNFISMVKLYHIDQRIEHMNENTLSFFVKNRLVAGYQ